MDTPTGDFQRGAIRVSDSERDQAVAELTEHYQAGRLTLEEFDDRSSQALQARTGSDLGALFTDLPKGAAPSVLAQAGRTPAGVQADLGPRHAGRPVTARMIIGLVVASGATGYLLAAGLWDACEASFDPKPKPGSTSNPSA